jgi:DNA-binding PadR family transcriptional regulator
MADRPRSPLWMVVLALACEEPMHPYRMATLIKARGKDRVANVVQKNSVYQTLSALERAGLLAVHGTAREAHRPERTTYAATPLGRQTLVRWLSAALAEPAREFPEFPAALSLLGPPFTAEALRDLLERRIAAQEARLAQHLDAPPGLPRAFLLDDEYAAALLRAELVWLRGVVADLAEGRLAFPTLAELQALGALPGAPSEAALAALHPEPKS